jgi:AcrR family transcriptional regulator
MTQIAELESGRTRPLTPRGEGTRDALIKAALAEFADHGYAGARVEQITTRAGVGYGTFYKYFASKSDLVRSVMKEVYDDVFAHAISETHSNRPVSERVYLDLLASLRSFAKHRDTLLALDSAVGVDPELAAYLATLQERDVVEYADILRTTQGYAPVADPYLVSLAVNSLGDEVARRWMRSARFTGDDQQATEIAQILTAMCLSVVAGASTIRAAAKGQSA